MSTLTRREFFRRSAVTTGAAAAASIVPFSFVRAAALAPAEATLNDFLHTKRMEMRSPGLSATVTGVDGVLWAGGDGWADREAAQMCDEDTVFMLASVSKTILCVGVLAVVQDGDLDLDVDVNTYLPWEVHIPGFESDPITTRMLLTHTSAIKDRWSVWGAPGEPDTLYSHGDSPISMGDFLESYLTVAGSEYDATKNFSFRSPGTKYAYSNVGADLAAYVAEVITGVDFDEWCKQRIFTPLGMTQTGYRLADISTPNLAMPYKYKNSTGKNTPIYQYGYPDYASGALRTAGPQLAKFCAAVMNDGTFDGTEILSPALVQEMLSDQHVTYWDQGLIWWSGFGPGFRHTGHTGADAGVRARMFFSPKRKVGVMTMANSSLGGTRLAAFRDVEQRLFDVFL